APFRAPALAGSAYPAEPTELTAVLAAYGDIPLSRSDHWATGRRGDRDTGRRGDGASSGDAGPRSGTAPGHEQSRWTVRGADPAGTVRGVISPHIDYHRGGPIYYRVWQRAANAVRAADLVIVFGTDHLGSPGQVTLTRQHYATPFGVLPTDLDAVASVAEAVGPDFAFAEELHHRTEHSIELAAVWLHSIWRERPGKIVPILCGSFHQFIAGRQHPPFGQLIEALRAATAGRRVFVVAAADLAHVGPAFGDAMRYGPDECAHLREIDATLLETVCHGDAEAFFAVLRDEGDQRKVCGLPPIYLALRYLGGLTRERQNERDGPGATGEVVDYALCPADSNSISWVSVAGVLLR
ncbi:MAG: AmmeMemoRadiSam system protein B, partial [Chloroflexi bacterium]|nr:AmmeMemoRadiSam system protein B [Chloroflexota bacterium]